MFRRVFSVFLVSVILIAASPSAMASGGDPGNFRRVNAYTQGQFADVAAGEWFAGNVETAYELGLMKGSSATCFSPNGNVTVAETVAMAARLHSIYTTGAESFVQKSPWYQTYVDYAEENGIISEGQFSDYTGAATRLQFAAVFAAALPDEALAEMNAVDYGAIPDTDSAAVYKLYRAGILTGSDTLGTFRPGTTITRAEASAIAARMADSSLRKDITLRVKTEKIELTAEEVYAQCAPAVFYIEIYDESGEAVAFGSGFFISRAGKAVTNYHVIAGAASAKITVADTGEVYDVLGVYDYNKNQDWAVLKIAGSGFDFLDIGDAATAVGGATVYALGNPLGLQSTMSQGLISNPARTLGGRTYCQTSAVIAQGSSGGALINKYGEVIGITTAYIEDGQSLTLALPIGVISAHSTAECVPLDGLEEALAAEKASARLTATKTSVTLEAGGSATLTLSNTCGSHFSYYIKATPDDELVATCALGPWSDDKKSQQLYITAVSGGTTPIYVYLFDAATDKSLTGVTITVTVPEKLGIISEEPFYAGLYPVPDFGYLTYTPLYNTSKQSIIRFKCFYYQFDALCVDAETAVDIYLDALDYCGFTYVKSYKTGDGYTMMQFQQADYGIRLLFGVSPFEYKGEPCLLVGVYY